MFRRAVTITAAAALAIATATVPAFADPPAERASDSPGAWVNTGYRAFGGTETGHVGTNITHGKAREYGPGGWEFVYMQEGTLEQPAQLRQLLRVPAGAKAPISDTPLDLGPGDGGFLDENTFDVDPVTGDAVICSPSDSGGTIGVAFRVRPGTTGTWSALRFASASGVTKSFSAACAVNGGRVAVAAGTLTDGDGTNVTVGTSAASTSVAAPVDIALSPTGPTRVRTATDEYEYAGADASVAVVATGSAGFALSATLRAAQGDQDQVVVTLTPWTSSAPETGVTVHAGVVPDDAYGVGAAAVPTDLGGGTVLVADVLGAWRVTGSTVARVIDATTASGGPDHDMIPVSANGAGPAWVLHRDTAGQPRRLHRITATTDRAITLPTATGYSDLTVEEDLFSAPYYGWDDSNSTVTPGGGLWIGQPCRRNTDGYANHVCVSRYDASGAVVGRPEALFGIVSLLPYDPDNGEAIWLPASRNPVSYHFDSDAPVDAGPVTVTGTRTDGTVVLTAGQDEYLSVDSSDPSGNALVHRWTVNGSVLTGNDFDAGSSTTVAYRFATKGTYTVTHQARDAVGHLGAVTTTLVHVVDPGTPLTNFGPVQNLAVTQSRATGQLVAQATWTALSGADSYRVVVTRAPNDLVADTLETGTSSEFSPLETDAGKELTVSVTPNQGSDVGQPATTTFTVQGTPPDTTAPTGTYTVSPARAWAKQTTVTVRQTALSNAPDAESDVTRTITWGDSAKYSAWGSPASKKTVTHSYAKAGTFTPKVQLTDAAGNVRTITLTKVTVKADKTKPSVTITRPAKKSLPKVSAWKTLRGTAKDSGTGVLSVYAFVVQKRGKYYYAYNYGTKKWSKRYTSYKKALGQTWPGFGRLTAKGAWTMPAIKGLVKGTITVRAEAYDRVSNMGAATTSQVLTR